MNWLSTLTDDHILYPVIDECLSMASESYYLAVDVDEDMLY